MLINKFKNTKKFILRVAFFQRIFAYRINIEKKPSKKSIKFVANFVENYQFFHKIKTKFYVDLRYFTLEK